MMSFPLSSHKLVYDEDAENLSISEGRWQQVIAVAIETDKAKLELQNRCLVSMGGEPETSFGRYEV